MKGYATVSSPYARKVRVATIETGQPDLIEWRMLSREERPEVVPPVNPLGKVPAVVLDSGEALYDSPVICAYVDSLHDGSKLIPPEGPDRWEVLRREALGDGLAEAVVAVAQESQKAPETRSQRVIERQGVKVAAALAALEDEVPSFRDPPSMGEIAAACALGYMEYRGVAADWRGRYGRLAAWYAKILTRPSFVQTMPEDKA
ncbi:MAG: glutathione S-transferase N-terminal domain-containing protein [Alphaproteobacteria bacterium]|nr:glutathione S-transferase N-terminal domain-containing protein [Alphaproteobacteria bacterium]